MRTYRVTFHGREAGAIGVMHSCSVLVEVEQETDIQLKLYATHEHISNVQYEEVKP